MIVCKECAERQRREKQEGDALLKKRKKEGQGNGKKMRWGFREVL
jgi:hypothetical protein